MGSGGKKVKMSKSTVSLWNFHQFERALSENFGLVAGPKICGRYGLVLQPRRPGREPVFGRGRTREKKQKISIRPPQPKKGGKNGRKLAATQESAHFLLFFPYFSGVDESYFSAIPSLIFALAQKLALCQAAGVARLVLPFDAP